MGKIIVLLDKVTNLKDGDGIGRSDPYVKLHLEQDNTFFDKNYGKQESTHKGNTCNPEYGETFEFDGVDTLNNLVLHVRVMDDDFGLDDKLGGCTIKLEDEDLSSEPKAFEKKVDNKWFCKDARIHVQISYEE
eukprot:CAMPEP_0194049096 /NCGR_PEP_ID=MMETSP0009_2-20130614/29639_1 /TAXON_ID=210454 /ORGANISM="Grammatophora oceanica, Strain CCMP 410" /LENGTH=132 /DNA_ID=CAMNT_0038695165 /DNA_START=75 /DNA_END=473 /DNA_ORIENTATION=-